MFAKNLRYFRLQRGLSKKDLANKAGLSAALLTYYEAGERQPSVQSLAALSKALSVSPALLLESAPALSFSHGAFRKNASLSKASQDYVRSFVEDYFGRFYTVLSFFPPNVLPPIPWDMGVTLPSSSSAVEDAKAFRQALGLPLTGPLPTLVDHLENQGFLLCPVTGLPGFDGINGYVSGRPYIAFNQDVGAERIRHTLVHELAHLYFGLGEEEEEIVNEIAGETLFPKENAIRELGPRCYGVNEWMTRVAKEYGISMYSLVYNGARYGIFSSSTAKSFYVRAGQIGWRHNEPSRCEEESTHFFEQLVYRAVDENEITIQRAAELLRTSYQQVEASTRSLA